MLATIWQILTALPTIIRSQLLPLEAEFEEETEYGEKFRITGSLTGPNGTTLRVVSIWMIESATAITKFITLYPVKEY